MMKTNRFAILTPDHQILSYGSQGWEHINSYVHTSNLGNICVAGLHADLTHLWVAPGVVVANENFATWGEKDGFKAVNINWDDSGKLIASASAIRHDDYPGRRQITVVFVENGKWRCFEGLSPKVTYITIEYIQRALGVAISGSPGPVGWALLKRLHPEYDNEGISTVDLTKMHFGEGAEELIWESPVLKTGLTGYLHKADRNMAFTAASTGSDSKYGVGIPEHVKERIATHVNDCSPRKFNGKDVGVYKCNIKGKDMPLLPEPWGGSRKGAWVASPQVRLLLNRGYQVEITEAYIFPKSYALLDKWGTFLWEARQSFKNDTEKWKHPLGRACAAKAIKEIANSLIGFLRYANFDEKNADKRRTDIRTQTISRNVELVYHNIAKIEREERLRPVMVYMDALYYVTSSEYARADIPTLFKREYELGGYKYEGSIQISPQVTTILMNRSLSVSQKLMLLNKIGWVQ